MDNQVKSGTEPGKYPEGRGHDFVERAVAAHGDHEGNGAACRFRGQAQGLARSAGLDEVEGETEPGERVADRRPEARGAAATGRGRGGSYVKPTRPPPVTRRKSVIVGKRIMGFCRFSSPIVVAVPP